MIYWGDRHHVRSKEWLSGLEQEIAGLFDYSPDEADESTADSKHGAFSDAFEIDIHNEAIRALLFKKGAREYGQTWVRKHPFAQFLRLIGKENAAKIKHLRIKWGPNEYTLGMGESMSGYEVAPRAIGFMSVVCRLCLPNLEEVSLKPVNQNGVQFNCIRDCGLSRLRENSDSAWEDCLFSDSPVAKSWVVGRWSEPRVTPNRGWYSLENWIKALDLLGQACNQVSLNSRCV
jgi:hypothetical protein